MIEPPVPVLLVEDDEDDYLITRDLLDQQSRRRFRLDWCDTYESGLQAIREQRHAAYLVDYRLGARTGLELVREAFAGRSPGPVIMLTSQADYETDLEATEIGVTDYLLKQQLDPVLLERSIRYAMRHHEALARLARSEERYALAVDAIDDGIWDWDVARGEVFRSPRCFAILGQAESSESLPKGAWGSIIHPDYMPGILDTVRSVEGGENDHIYEELPVRHADGSWRWVLVRGLAVRDAEGRATRVVGSLSDITERRSAEDRLVHEASHDPLTGLPNRAYFVDHLEAALAAPARSSARGADHDVALALADAAGAARPGQCAVLFIDLDRFKLVNDSLTHIVGDALLVAVARRIADVLRPGDTVARMGGDEFTILLDGLDPDIAERFALSVAHRVQNALAQAFDIEGRRLFVAASAGIAFGHPGATAAEVLRNADIAMFEAKRRGGDRCVVFDDSMHRRVNQRLARENELRQVIDQGLLEVHYQPVTDLPTGAVVGFEALARWPAGWAPVAPSEFVAIAEDIGLIGELGRHVLNEALTTLARWRAAGLVPETMRMSVNVSGRQLDESGFPDDVLRALATKGLPGSALSLEITEGTFMREPERTVRIVSDLCTAGVGLELDDFGTGYSSLASLHQFPLAALKIDQGFVAAMETDADSEMIVRSILVLAKSLGLRVVAEGIETSSQLERLQLFGCDCGQGFLFSKAVPAADAERLLRSWPASRFAARPGVRALAPSQADRPLASR